MERHSCLFCNFDALNLQGLSTHIERKHPKNHAEWREVYAHPEIKRPPNGDLRLTPEKVEELADQSDLNFASLFQEELEKITKTGHDGGLSKTEKMKLSAKGIIGYHRTRGKAEIMVTPKGKRLLKTLKARRKRGITNPPLQLRSL